jgi:hypothetical protein
MVGVGSTSLRTILVSHDETAVADIRKIRDKIFGWQSDQVGQTLCTISLCGLDFNFDIRSFFGEVWDWRSLFNPLALCPRFVLQAPTFIPSDDCIHQFVILIGSLQKSSTNFPPPLQLVGSESFVHHIRTKFLHSQIVRENYYWYSALVDSFWQ